jgi:hypothetical protein
MKTDWLMCLTVLVSYPGSSKPARQFAVAFEFASAMPGGCFDQLSVQQGLLSWQVLQQAVSTDAKRQLPLRRLGTNHTVAH